MTDVPRATPDLALLTSYAERLGPLLSYPWHPQQRVALASATDTTVILGGTQSGKSQSAIGMISRVMRREGPIYRRLKDIENRPLKIWVAPKTGEKALSYWEPALRLQAFAGIDHSYVQGPQRVFTWDDDFAKGNTLWLKSQDQGLLAFESDAVDVVVFDEEPLDRRLVSAAQGRLTTTNGVIVHAYTPLHGLTWTHGAYYVPCVRDQYRKGDRVWRMGKRLTVIQMGMADNPAAVAGGGVERLQNDPSISESEKRTRLFGEYGFAEGLLFPVLAGLFTDQPDSHYLLDALPKGRPYTWVQTMDPNKRHGGMLTALDHEGNRYFVHEHYAENLPDTLHAQRYRDGWKRYRLREDQVMCYADPGGAGAQAILNLADVGLLAEAVPKGPGSVKANIEMMRRALWIDPQRLHPVTGKPGSPSVFFLRTLRSQWAQDGVEYDEARVLWELRQYRQKEGQAPDVPVKEHDDVCDCALYSFAVRPFVPGAAETAWGVEVRTPIKSADHLSQRATQSFDKLTERIVREQRRVR